MLQSPKEYKRLSKNSKHAKSHLLVCFKNASIVLIAESSPALMTQVLFFSSKPRSLKSEAKKVLSIYLLFKTRKFLYKWDFKNKMITYRLSWEHRQRPGRPDFGSTWGMVGESQGFLWVSLEHLLLRPGSESRSCSRSASHRSTSTNGLG